ncbi:hypothetical protein [Lutimonas zeaxanthinifaciens]|uniref:hypothetical protein n=1 Tax=Lutimonas zeaxanthinifaciens TaxID=3060215 RepID=UPI00265CFE90|nr:hypothetical protein [Lutimonas sp. YSD2104]WKK66992.1 hypothetical protein QZH61_05055 [Lutimonas sp. YSD2104]
MEIRGVMASLPHKFRLFVVCFVLLLNVGFFTGFSFVRVTTSLNSQGIQQNYLGNEDDENAEVMHFKKSEQEILTLIHNHVLSLSLIFFILGTLLYMCQVPDRLASFLMFEPFLSLLLTFGGIYILWKGVTWFKYVIMVSGFAMVLSLILMSVLVIKCCLYPQNKVV